MDVPIWEIAFGTFSLFMLKFAWDLISYADKRNKEDTEDLHNT